MVANFDHCSFTKNTVYPAKYIITCTST